MDEMYPGLAPQRPRKEPAPRGQPARREDVSLTFRIHSLHTCASLFQSHRQTCRLSRSCLTRGTLGGLVRQECLTYVGQTFLSDSRDVWWSGQTGMSDLRTFLCYCSSTVAWSPEAIMLRLKFLSRRPEVVRARSGWRLGQ